MTDTTRPSAGARNGGQGRAACSPRAGGGGGGGLRGPTGLSRGCKARRRWARVEAVQRGRKGCRPAFAEPETMR